MKNLLKWDLKQTFKSKTFIGFGIIFILFTIIFMLPDIEGSTGYELFLKNCSNLNSSFILMIGIYSGILIAGSFEDRTIQAAIMAGNSRLKIIISKLLCYSLVIAVFTLLSIGISSSIGFLITKEIGTNINTIIIQGLVYILVQVSFTSICFLISMKVKKLSTAIPINLIGLIAINGIVQSLMDKDWTVNILKFTPAGQTFLTLADTSKGNLTISVVASIFGLLVTVIVTYVIFRKEELK